MQNSQMKFATEETLIV